MRSRAAVFTESPQAVEVYQAGAWGAGELLGWRHEVDGACQVWVRVVSEGIEGTAWTDLAALRLPTRSPAPAAAGGAMATQKLPRASGPRAGGRRRAPEDAGTAVAPASAVPPRGGRRRAPEGSDSSVAAAAPARRPGGRRRAPEDPSAAGVSATIAPRIAVPEAGRHRAAMSVAAGRHRKADTGRIPAVPEAGPVAVGAVEPVPAGPPPRLEDTVVGRTRMTWSRVAEPEPGLLTRPLQLGEQNTRSPAGPGRTGR